MSSFEMETTTKSRLRDVEVLSQKNRQPDEEPGAKLSFETSLSNHELGQIAGHLKGFLFTNNAGGSVAQSGTLDGIEPVSDLPDLSEIGQKCGWLTWEAEYTGYTLSLIYGLGQGESNIVIDDCTITGLRIKCKQGGTFLARYSVESSNVSSEQWGRLAKLKGREVDKPLLAPEVYQRAVEDNVAPIDKKRAA